MTAVIRDKSINVELRADIITVKAKSDKEVIIAFDGKACFSYMSEQPLFVTVFEDD